MGLQLIAGPLGSKLWVDLDYHLITGELYSLQESLETVISQKTTDEAFMNTIASIQSGKLEVQDIPLMWAGLEKIDATIETRPTDARILTALSFESHSDMWNWFDEQVTKPAQHLTTFPMASIIAMPPSSELPNNWILPLFRSVRLKVLGNR
jgi:hypothetical protein